MQTSQFIRKIKERTGIQDDAQIRQYLDAVFSALRDRISIGGAHNLAAQLPEELKEIWEAGVVHDVARAVKGTEHLSRQEFLAKIQNTAHLADIYEAERITQAVFETLREHVTDGVIHAVANQLPDDIRELWLGSAQPRGLYTSEEIGPAAVEVFRSDNQLQDEIERLLMENDEVDESTIDVYVHQGKVRLTGMVRSAVEREAAEEAAKMALGVTEVENELEVEAEGGNEE